MSGGIELECADLRRLLDSLPRRISDIASINAARHGGALAVRQGAREWTFAELTAAVDVAAASLASAGVRAGDRVLLVGENCAALIALLLGIARLDAWAVVVNARLAAREVDAIRQHCEPRRSVYLAEVSAEAAAHAAREVAVEALPIASMGEALLGKRDDRCRAEAVSQDPAQQVAALVYTSGTTGEPKGVMLTHRNLLYIAKVSSTLRALRGGDRVYGVLPLSHVYGLASVGLGTLFGGACVDLEPRFSAQRMLAALTDREVSVLHGVPPMYAKLVDLVRTTARPVVAPRLRACFAGGAPLDASLKADVERVLGVTLHNGYGLTEASPTVSQTRLDAPRDDCSVGKVLPGIETRIVVPADPLRREVATGEPGELWVRGPNIMRGYYRNPALTARNIDPEGWLNTGDLARCEPDGALFIVGRTKELIIRSGFNVYPPEVEAVLNSHPAVMHSAVVGRQVPGNEEVIAFVELKPKTAAAPAEIAAFLRGQLAPYKQPAEIHLVESLPIAPNGKVLKHRLADLARGLAATDAALQSSR